MIAKAKKIDGSIIFVLLCFMVISTVVIYSATMGTRYEGEHREHLFMFAVFYIPMLVMTLFDYRVLLKYTAYLFYGVGIISLVLVLLIGETINYSTRWINLGFMMLQPSELVKLAVILLIAHLLKRRNGEPLHLFADILLIIGVVMLPVLLIMKQPDLGTAIVYICILVGMLWVANMRIKHIILGLSAVVVVVGTVVTLYFVNIDLFHKVITPGQLERIETFLDPTKDPDSSYHVRNSMLAISSGQLYGDGFRQGTYVQRGFVPFTYADSIFVVIGEEFGFLGVALLLFFYFLLIYRMVRIATECQDLSGSYIVVGVISMFTLQIFENIAMHVGLMPMTGIALPFISYGGSSLLSSMLAIGLVLSVKIHSDQPEIFDRTS